MLAKNIYFAYSVICDNHASKKRNFSKYLTMVRSQLQKYCHYDFKGNTKIILLER